MQTISRINSFKVELDRERLYLALIFAVALIYRLVPLNRGLGEDELFTAVQFIEVRSIFRTIFFNIAFNNHIGYSIMARISESIFGRGEWVLRLPALLLGMATLYVMYIFSRSLLGHYAALLATLLLALSPAHIAWSVEARGYSAMIFFTLLSSYLFFKLVRQPQRRQEILFIATSVFAIYVHLYAIFVTCIQVLYVLYLTIISKRKTSTPSIDKDTLYRFRNYFFVVGGFVLLLYVPVSWFMIRDLASRGWSSFNPLFPWEVVQGLSGSEQSLLTVLIVLVSLWGWFSIRQQHRFEATYFVVLLLVPLFLVWLVHPFDLYPRFFAYWLPYLLILFTAGIVSLINFVWKGKKTVFYTARVLSFCVLLTTIFNWTMKWQSVVSDEGYREVSQSIVQGADPLAAYCAIGGDRSIWKYYIHKPMVFPLTMADFHDLSRKYPEVRCVYYAASWEDQEQTKIAQFLFQHASSSHVKELTWFVFRNDGTN